MNIYKKNSCSLGLLGNDWFVPWDSLFKLEGIRFFVR